MELNVLLSTIVLVSFIVTVVLAVGSYLAYKARERRRPRATRGPASDEPIYFDRFFPQRPGTVGGAGSDLGTEEQRGPAA